MGRLGNARVRTARAVGRCPADIAYTFPLVVAGAVLRAASRAGPLGTRVTGPTRIALTLATSRADPASTAVGVATAVEHCRNKHSARTIPPEIAC
jgi:hypothetical protein